MRDKVVSDKVVCVIVRDEVVCERDCVCVRVTKLCVKEIVCVTKLYKIV